MGTFVLVCGNVFDGMSDHLAGPTEILVEGGQIAAVGSSPCRVFPSPISAPPPQLTS